MAGRTKRRESIAKQLKDARVLAGMSSRQIGKLLGISHSTIHHWEAGKYTPRADQFVELLRLYGAAQHDGPD